MELKREWIENLLFGAEPRYRFTQDSPILPETWLQFGKRGPNAAIDLLLTPYWGTPSGELSVEIGKRLDAERERGVDQGPALVAYNRSAVVARLSIESLVRVVMPLTRWWREAFVVDGLDHSLQLSDVFWPELERHLATWVTEKKPGRSRLRAAPSKKESWAPSEDLLWFIRLVGSLRLAASADVNDKKDFDEITLDSGSLADDFVRILQPPPLRRKWYDDEVADMVFSIGLNRRATPALRKSSLAVKADAARHLFSINCSNLSWAVVDSGVDATHPAFADRKSVDSVLTQSDASRGAENSRIKATYDFSRIRFLLTPDRNDIQERILEIDQGLSNAAGNQDLLSSMRHEREALMGLLETVSGRRSQRLRSGLRSGRAIDWDEFEDFLRVAHDQYVAPQHQHGTHVAGILGGNWKAADYVPDGVIAPWTDLIGICPDISLYDFRVMDDQGNGDEFSVMAALQFIRHLNSREEVQRIHGVNLSLSILHDVSNFACGRTPVCEEARRLVASGVVVVAAAGNRGYMNYLTSAGDEDEGYRSISITDPGNAEEVITVGSTHRQEPHTYGVSYFSSRGPTGDGRAKPDIVAPGEKIEAPVPGGAAVKDGTSMAAPHVSGIAALLLARHGEFRGEPAKVKEVLVKTATDLGREPYFQGGGLIDALRAVQYI